MTPNTEWRATHRIVCPADEAPLDDCEALVMLRGGVFCTEDAWTYGGRWRTRSEIEARGYTLEPYKAPRKPGGAR